MSFLELVRQRPWCEWLPSRLEHPLISGQQLVEYLAAVGADKTPLLHAAPAPVKELLAAVTDKSIALHGHRRALPPRAATAASRAAAPLSAAVRKPSASAASAAARASASAVAAGRGRSSSRASGSAGGPQQAAGASSTQGGQGALQGGAATKRRLPAQGGAGVKRSKPRPAGTGAQQAAAVLAPTQPLSPQGSAGAALPDGQVSSLAEALQALERADAQVRKHLEAPDGGSGRGR